MKKLTTLIFSLIIQLTYAQVNEITLDEPQASFFNLSNFKILYLNSTYTEMNARNRDAIYMDHLVYFRYDIAKNQNIRWVPVYSNTFSQKNQKSYQGEYAYCSLRYYINNILTEDKHGLSLHFQNRNYIFDGEDRNRGYDSYHRGYFFLSKNTDNFTFELNTYAQIYNRNGRDPNTNTWRTMCGTFAYYNFNDNRGLGLGSEWYTDHRDGKKKIGDDRMVLYLPYLRYNKGKGFVELYATYTAAKSGDGDHSIIIDDFHENGSLTLDIGYYIL
ncbi:hypothetical protein [Halobacteriovorax sp. YZS-1-1]|uniref:hypothetical protein n=1 Tax=unclassified Halobacteriovorax TaxID=2639665 RepID=UPI0039994ED7